MNFFLMKIKLKVERQPTKGLFVQRQVTALVLQFFFILIKIITSPISTTTQLKFLCKFDHLWRLQPVISIQENLSVVIIEHESIIKPFIF